MLFFPRDALDEILDLIESVSEGFLPTFETVILHETPELKVKE